MRRPGLVTVGVGESPEADVPEAADPDALVEQRKDVQAVEDERNI